MQSDLVNRAIHQPSNNERPPARRAGVWLQRRVLSIVNPLAAGLVLVEAILLLVGVIFRYVLNRPLSWTDELATMLFLWLAMMGAVLATARGEHMRLTFVLNRVSREQRALLETLGTVVVSGLLVVLIPLAITQSMDDWAVMTPALEWPDGIRVLAIAAGTALMLMVSLGKLQAEAKWTHIAISLVVVALGLASLWLGKPWLLGAGNFKLLLYFVGVVGICVALGVPIGFAFGAGTVAYLATATRVPLEIVIGRIDEGTAHLILLSIPLFVMLGLVMEVTGLARALVSFIALLLGHVRGGLSYVLLGAMLIVSGISGSKAADMAAVAPMLFPEIKKRGGDPGEMVAQLAAAGAMSETVPPSFVLIIIGSVTGVSIASLFTGGLLPALVGAIAVGIVCGRKAKTDDTSNVKRATFAEIRKAGLYALPALALPFVIRAAVVEGVATATEVSSIGIVYCLLVGSLLYRRMDWRKIYPMLVDTAALSGAILIIIGMATAMAWALTQSGFSTDLANTMMKMPGGAVGFMAVSILVFVVLGSLLEGVPAIVLFGPLLFPIARSIGIHEVHYAIVAVLSMGIGLFAPPFGVGFYAACAIGRVSPDDAMGKVWPYLGALSIALILVATIPWISTGFL
ncbi:MULTISPECIES: TRAP transporter large permease [Paraburkholderia]|uniref:TRAP transporter large permease subunit n=1 Tax=Paraburkholderia metrosideri TaxID=580937 RepID=A0ABW9E611_9BURK